MSTYPREPDDDPMWPMRRGYLAAIVFATWALSLLVLMAVLLFPDVTWSWRGFLLAVLSGGVGAAVTSLVPIGTLRRSDLTSGQRLTIRWRWLISLSAWTMATVALTLAVLLDMTMLVVVATIAVVAIGVGIAVRYRRLVGLA